MNEKIAKLLFAASLSKDLKSVIHLADTKAHIALVMQSTLIVAVMTIGIEGDRLEVIKTWEPILKILFLFFLLCFLSVSIIGLVLTINVFFPRKSVKRHNPDFRGLMFYEEIKSYTGSGSYYDTFKEMNETKLIEEMAIENYNLSIIIDEKMKYVRRCMRLLIVSIILSVIVFFFGIIVEFCTTP